MEVSPLTAEGHSGIVRLLDDRVQILRPGPMAGISGQRNSQLLLSALSAVEFKDAGVHVNGWIRFRCRDEEALPLARSQLWKNPHVVFFNYDQREAFKLLAARLREILDHIDLH